MNLMRRGILTAAIAGSMLAGGAIGATAFGAGAGSAQTATTTTSTTSTSSGRSGVFKPNEDPAHEAGESAEREAQEDAGQVPTVP